EPAPAAAEATRRGGRARAPGRPRRGQLPRLGPPRGQGDGDHRRRQRHRPRGGARLRPRGSRRADRLPRGGRGRRRDRAPGRGGGPPRGAGARRRGRPGALPRDRPAGRRRLWANRRAGQQRRLPDEPQLARGDPGRGVGPHLPDQHHRDVPSLQGEPPAHGLGVLDHQHLLDQLRPAGAHAVRLRGHQGGDRQLHGQPRSASGRAGHPRQQRGAGAGLDAADPLHHAARAGRDLRHRHADGPGRATGRGRAGVRDARDRRGELRLRRPRRGDRRQADHL
ncbi:MAG: Dehydrogenases with different specificities (related to short-chain alcohol dehydrogenases), partial [uncultured Solirubrobacterales bacterium]